MGVASQWLVVSFRVCSQIKFGFMNLSIRDQILNAVVDISAEDSSHPRMDCIEEAIAGCDECPSPTPEILSRRMRCVACRKECHEHHGN